MKVKLKLGICSIVLASVMMASFTRSEASNVTVNVGKGKTINSNILGRDMPIVIHLPSDYESCADSYPVLYVMGSDYRTRFAMWTNSVTYLSEIGQIPNMIVVGIDLPDGNSVLIPKLGEKPDTSGLDNHLSFLTTEVIPFIENNYRANSFRLLFGASNSGLFCVYALLSDPASFNSYFASSPMLGWCNELLIKKFEQRQADIVKGQRMLFMIYSDDDYDRVTNFIPGFVSQITAKKPSWLSIDHQILHNQGHVPAADIISFFLKAFPDYNPEKELKTLDSFKNHYKLLSTRYGFEIPVPRSTLMDFGLDLYFQQKKLTEAETVFQYAIKIYPRFSRGYVGMGIVRRDQKQLAEARKFLQKAITIDPEDSLAKAILDRLSAE